MTLSFTVSYLKSYMLGCGNCYYSPVGYVPLIPFVLIRLLPDGTIRDNLFEVGLRTEE